MTVLISRLRLFFSSRGKWTKMNETRSRIDFIFIAPNGEISDTCVIKIKNWLIYSENLSNEAS